MQEVPWQNIEHPSCLILSERQNISTTLRQDFCQAEFIKVNNWEIQPVPKLVHHDNPPHNIDCCSYDKIQIQTLERFEFEAKNKNKNKYMVPVGLSQYTSFDTYWINESMIFFYSQKICFCFIFILNKISNN